MSMIKAFQIEVRPAQGARQVFFIQADTEEGAVELLSRRKGVPRDATLKLQRRLSDSELDLHQIGPGSVVRWL
jgi:hypothetical protein